jgi:hypothetical protein
MSNRDGLTSKVKAAIDRMVFDALPWDEAADRVGLTRRSMRRALEKPAVVRTLREQKRAFREAASAGNVARLIDIRDKSKNAMAQVAAIKQLEAEDTQEGRSAIARTPGVVIVITDRVGEQKGLGGPPAIDVTPREVVE